VNSYPPIHTHKEAWHPHPQTNNFFVSVFWKVENVYTYQNAETGFSQSQYFPSYITHEKVKNYEIKTERHAVLAQDSKQKIVT
jgi:hypothetical protein